MLGKRLRRTTSMSHLGPGSIPATPLEINGKSHSVPDKAARPLICEAGADIIADVNRGDVYMTAVGMPGCALPPLQTQIQTQTQTQRPSWPMHVGANCGVSMMAGLAGWKTGLSQGQSGVMPNFEEHSEAGSLVAYQMGLWIQSSMHASHGLGKLVEQQLPISPVDFLDMCYYCKRRLAHERDIFIYRGDTAFCSEECRHRQIVNDERRSSRAASKQRGRSRSRARSSTSETAVAA